MKTKEEIIAFGRKVISTEIHGATALLESLSDDFYNACKLIFENKGRVILSGMGKSGHIANKISSTLSSTGTASFFLHPAESIHGDLGMIERKDIVIAISNSGRTPELQGLINYVSRFEIDMIAITSNRDSELGLASRYCLELPKVDEACPLKLAPTTSTTNTLMLGDAIAITLLDMKGFSEEDFRVFHPGGMLGARLIKIADIMHKGDSIPLIREGALMRDAILVITSHKFGCVGIVNDKKELVGMITDGDIRTHMDNNFLNKAVEEVMTVRFKFARGDDNISKVILLMQKNNITNMFIVKDGYPEGIIHIHDLLKLGVV